MQHGNDPALANIRKSMFDDENAAEAIKKYGKTEAKKIISEATRKLEELKMKYFKILVQIARRDYPVVYMIKSTSDCGIDPQRLGYFSSTDIARQYLPSNSNSREMDGNINWSYSIMSVPTEYICDEALTKLDESPRNFPYY